MTAHLAAGPKTVPPVAEFRDDGEFAYKYCLIRTLKRSEDPVALLISRRKIFAEEVSPIF
jgi:hypothetical protein